MATYSYVVIFLLKNGELCFAKNGKASDFFLLKVAKWEVKTYLMRIRCTDPLPIYDKYM